MYFAPFIVRAEHERKVPVVIERATARGLESYRQSTEMADGLDFGISCR